MLFKDKDTIKIIKTCPVVRASAGVLEMPAELVAKVAGAVTDGIEWMVLLIGERSADGFEVKVTDFRVPKQRRTGGDVSMTEPMEGDGSTVGPEVVGVLHSHHRMGAFFSGTDNTELNPFFFTSIVVAQAEKSALGFAYKAEGKVELPCGNLGRVAFALKVTGSERWAPEVVHAADDGSWGDCDKLTITAEETDTVITTKALAPEACGLSGEDTADKPLVYGRAGGEALLTEIRQNTTGYGHQGGTFQGNNGGYRHPGFVQNGGGNLSRRERKALKRAGKYSARRAGLFGMESTGRHEVGGADDVFEDGVATNPGAHKAARSYMDNNSRSCDSCSEGETERLYLLAPDKGPSGQVFWLCAECYDFWDEYWDQVDDAVAKDDARDYKRVADAGDPSSVYCCHPFVAGAVGQHCMGKSDGSIDCMRTPDDPIHYGYPAVCWKTMVALTECKCGHVHPVVNFTPPKKLTTVWTHNGNLRCDHSAKGCCRPCADAYRDMQMEDAVDAAAETKTNRTMEPHRFVRYTPGAKYCFARLPDGECLEEIDHPVHQTGTVQCMACSGMNGHHNPGCSGTEKAAPVGVTSSRCSHLPAAVCEKCARELAESLGVAGVLLPSNETAH